MRVVLRQLPLHGATPVQMSEPQLPSLDCLAAEKWNSPEESLRLCVSSARKSPFGRRSPVAVRLRPRTCVPARTPRAYKSSHRTRRVLHRNGIPSIPPASGMQPTGYHHSRPISSPEHAGGVLRLSYPIGVNAKRLWESKFRVITGERRRITVYEANANDPGWHFCLATEQRTISPLYQLHFTKGVAFASLPLY